MAGRKRNTKKISKKESKSKVRGRKKYASKRSFFGKIFHFLLWVVIWFFIISIGLTVIYKWVNPPVTPLMIGRALKEDASINKTWKGLEEISPYMVTAALASEDNRFLGHRGFDFGAIQKALDYNKSHSRTHGASTISQQTAKNVFLWQGRSWLRKGMEVYFTFLIERIWGKERIMEVYLNVIEMGNGIYGAEAAAQHYFNCSAKQLSAYQAAAITACYPNPRRWNPAHPTSYIQGRISSIRRLMPKMGKVAFDKESRRKARERYLQAEEKRIKKNGGKRIQL